MLTFTEAIEDVGAAADARAADVDKQEHEQENGANAITAAIAAYLAPHAPKLAAAVIKESGLSPDALAKEQPGAADVHQTTALGNDSKSKAKTFLTTIAELKDGAKVVAVPDQVGDADPTQTDGLAEKRAPVALKPIDDANSHTPFPHDAGALANLRPDQTPRFLGALTDQDKLPTKRVALSGLTAIQDRVNTGKVADMQENPPDKPPVVVRTGDRRNLIADGHHRLAAMLLSGAKTAVVRFHDIAAESTATKSLWKLRSDGLEEVEYEAAVAVAKFVPDEQKVFGWASVTHIGGELVVDKQDDIIEPDQLEKASHDFVLYAREQGNMHEQRNVGRLIESIVFTPEKFEKCGLAAHDPVTGEQIYGWWVAFKTEDAETWAAIKSGDLPEFSIGGRAIRVPVPGTEPA